MGLMDILNGMQNGPRGQTEPGKGGMSPMTMAILAMLAYKAYQHVSAGQQAGTPANAPVPNAGGGQVAGQGGGLGDVLGNLLGGGAQAGNAGGNLGGMLGNVLGSGGLGNLLQGGLGNLGGMLAGGAAGGMLSGGLSDLVKQLEQNGQGDVAKSWVGNGTNRQISPEDLGKALGDDTVNSLAEQAGLSKVGLLQELSQHLPDAVNRMTPNGRVPTDEEATRML